MTTKNKITALLVIFLIVPTYATALSLEYAGLSYQLEYYDQGVTADVSEAGEYLFTINIDTYNGISVEPESLEQVLCILLFGPGSLGVLACPKFYTYPFIAILCWIGLISLTMFSICLR